MKKIMICAAVVAAALTVNAQTSEKTISGDVFVVPKLFTYGNGLNVVAITDDNEAVIYNDDLELVRKFKLDLPISSVVSKQQERKEEAKLISQNEYRTVTSTSNIYEDWKGTWNEAKEWAANNASQAVDMSVEEHDGYQFWPKDEGWYFRYETFGKKYPKTYFQWKAEDGTIRQVNCEYEAHYTGEWETVSEKSGECREFTNLFFEDYDENSHPDQDFYVSQTLFNEDEKFEYLAPYGDVSEHIEEGSDRDGDGIVDTRYISQDFERKGYNVMSEDGTVLQTIDAPYIEGVYRLNGKFYLVTTDYEEATFYKIDRQASKITKVQSTPALAKQVFGIDGTRRKQLSRGINIVVDSDGNAVKRLVK